MTDVRPAHVGILAMEVYFPKTYVAQRDLEVFDGVSSGKYTLGLGQDAMSFTGDREDVNSIALTVVTQLMEKYGIRPEEIGRLEVGTETLVDKSKSTKTVLMQLFESSGNTNIEGVSTINACYGATAALFNAIAWVESSAWDGRYAIVVGTDIAIYAKGPARPTGGCGGVAMLIGPNAPLVVDCRTRGTFSSNIWDFYKPDPSVEFPTVDGRLSQTCYLRALDSCFNLFCDKNDRVKKDGTRMRLSDLDFAVFHSPYNKLVQRSVSRLFFLDYRRQGASADPASELSRWGNVPLDQTYTDRELDLTSRKACGELYAKMAPCYGASKQIGNAYTASIYINLATLVATQAESLSGKRALMFSYGSGCMSTMFSVEARDVDASADSRFSLSSMTKCLQIFERLSERVAVSAAEYDEFMNQRERFHAKHSVTPTQSVEMLFDGTYYLVGIDAQFRRTYARKNQSVAIGAINGVPFAPQSNGSC